MDYTSGWSQDSPRSKGGSLGEGLAGSKQVLQATSYSTSALSHPSPHEGWANQRDSVKPRLSFHY
jgi:hypothetical protein